MANITKGGGAAAWLRGIVDDHVGRIHDMNRLLERTLDPRQLEGLEPSMREQFSAEMSEAAADIRSIIAECLAHMEHCESEIAAIELAA